ncbi:MAG: AsmA family protein, partial [Deltaproteobacteria bacterium]|nr:AsmA family protein [Deltaproteobacteria bacterium]
MRWKRIVGIAAVLFIAMIVAAYVILSTYDYNKFKPRIAKVVEDATGRKLTLAGDIDLEVGLSPTLVVEDVSFQNATWGSRPELAKLKRFEIQIALLPLILKRIAVKKILLVSPDILVETDSSGKSNLDFETEEGESQEPEDKKSVRFPRVRLLQVTIRNSRITYKDGRSAKTYVLTGQTLSSTSKDYDSPLKVEFKGTCNDIPLEFEGTLGPIHALADSKQSWPLDLTIKAAGTTVSVDGSVRDVMNLKDMTVAVHVEGRSIPEVARLLPMSDVPDLGPFKIGLGLSDVAPETYKISNLKVAFGNSDLKGSAELSLAQKRPRFTATLSSQNLDLRPVLSQTELISGPREPVGKSKKKHDKILPTDHLPLDVLKYADARLTFNAKAFLLPRLAINDLTFNMVLDEGHLMVERLEATIGGGTLDAQIDLNVQGKDAMLQAELQINQLDLDRMLKKLGLEDVAEGEVDIQVDVKSRGNSVAAIMAGLNGKFSFIIGQGQIYNKYIHILGSIFSQTLPRLLNPFLEATEYTQTNCIVSGFAVKDGLARSTALMFDSEDMTVLSKGEVNFTTEELDFSIKPVPKEGARKKKIKRSISLSTLAKQFRLSGTLADPSIEVDTRRASKTFGKGVGAALVGPAAVIAVLFTSKTGEK